MYLNSDFESMEEIEFMDRIETRKKIEECKRRINSPIWSKLSKEEQEERKRILIEINEMKRVCKDLDYEIKRDRLREN